MSQPGPHYQIEIVQFWRGEDANGRPNPLDWVIHIRTSPQKGNTFMIVGDTDSFDLAYVRDTPYDPDLWRGSFVVGTVSADLLQHMEVTLARVPVVRHSQEWNCQTWVWEGIRRLRRKGFNIDVHVNEFSLQTAMVCLLEAWEMGEI
ncbi:hypothetical protein BV22DRAFT_1001888 [Leucogyrophana mollusca]|uniref:Uncharacterized protein n=1 Tax=Leucogyrophana mollusca TaxID=85980 RepID=A0ACB8BWC0_9AGAM|nr:hypothetical protein BV22DRAFT_1001888 [Leucogyrophana mollusca]